MDAESRHWAMILQLFPPCLQPEEVVRRSQTRSLVRWNGFLHHSQSQSPLPGIPHLVQVTKPNAVSL